MKSNALLKNNFFQWLIFAISPILSIPIIVSTGLSKNKNTPLLLISLFIGILSYVYYPSITNDKAYYYFLYENFKEWELSEFSYFLKHNATDLIFYLAIYIFAQLKIKFSLLLMIFTTLTVYLLLVLLQNIVKKTASINYITYIFCIFLLIFSMSPPTLFSGIRFALSCYLALYAVFSYSQKDSSFGRAITYLVISSTIHFSCAIFIFLLAGFYLFKTKRKTCLTLLILSFVISLISSSLLSSVLSSFNLTGIFEHKAQSYIIGDDDFLTQNLAEGNLNNKLMHLLKTLWIYIAYFYIFIERKNNDSSLNLLILSLALCNVFMFAPTIYYRYLNLSLGIFVLLIAKDILIFNKHKLLSKALLLILFLSFSTNMYVMKNRFLDGLNGIQSLSLPTILIKEDYQYNDFLYK